MVMSCSGYHCIYVAELRIFFHSDYSRVGSGRRRDPHQESQVAQVGCPSLPVRGRMVVPLTQTGCLCRARIRPMVVPPATVGCRSRYFLKQQVIPMPQTVSLWIRLLRSTGRPTGIAGIPAATRSRTTASGRPSLRKPDAKTNCGSYHWTSHMR